ncbi:DUF2877 domain-containing protein [Modestobacter marinus]|uniref:DUF2877 domain-containing protein n=1 Tax=Modestobacter marinus TaxID=477641 RepID=UPI001C966E97|nr:DUF2877 domain-containing protein [Modestobacter marinus]
MRTIDESISGHGDATTREAARDGRAARAGVPTFPLPRASAPGLPHPRTVHTTVPAQASTGVAELLRGPVRAARVLLSVPAAVYLTVPTAQGNDVVGVLTSDAARLPLGCVLFRPANGRPLVAVPSGAPARVGGGKLVVGDLTVSAAAWWDPRPKLPTARPALLPEGVRQLRTALYGEGVPHSAFVLPGLPSGPSGPLAALRGAVRRADLDAALRTATRLVGLGPGLTPAGDDVLAGLTAGLVLLGHPSAERFAAGVTSLANGRTTELSRALLRHAAAGRVSGEFAAVLRGLVGDGSLAPAVDALLGSGSTSGRALALGMCTAIDLVDRTTRPR